MTAAAKRIDGAQSIRRALSVLRIVAAGQERGARLTDVVEGSGLARPTAHRILRVLVDEGAAEQDSATRRYLIGGEVSLLGLARAARFPIRALAAPELRELADTLGDTAFLTIRNGADSICIDRAIGSYPVKVLSIEVGARRPLGVGVGGLVLLAALPREEAVEVVERNARRLAAKGLMPQTLLRKAAEARSAGYAYAPIGVVPGSRALAVPVLAPDGTTAAAISLATIAERLPATRVAAVVAAMQSRARALERKLAEAAARRKSRR